MRVGTSLAVKKLKLERIDATVISGWGKEEDVFFLRIALFPTDMTPYLQFFNVKLFYLIKWERHLIIEDGAYGQ